MEPAKAKPVRKRRRWLIVGLLLVLVSLVAWWHWPRGDARFVGKWRRQIGRSAPDWLTLHANGQATFTNGTNTIWTSWRAEGTQLVFGTIAPREVVSLFDRFGARWYRITGSTYCFQEVRWDVDDVALGLIRMTPPGRSAAIEQVILTRIPE
jgi:hypothetical protein